MDDSNFFQAFGIFCCILIVILLSCSSLTQYMRRQNFIVTLAKLYSVRLAKNITNTLSQKATEKITNGDILQAVRKAALETRELEEKGISNDEIVEITKQAESEIRREAEKIANRPDVKETVLSVLNDGELVIKEIRDALATKSSNVKEGFTINTTPQCYSRGCSNNYPFGIGISDDCIAQPLGSPLHIRLDTNGNASTYSYKPPSAHGISGCAQTACPKKFDCMGMVNCWDCCNFN